MKLLLVEDDKEMAETVLSWLRSERYDVTHADNGDDGHYLLDTGNFAVAILDWELPGLSGPEICRKHRDKKGITPIIMLTGKTLVADRVAGLDSGADDYLSKPFSLKELSARIRALLRRPGEVKETVIKVGSLVLDPVKYRVSRNGVEVHLMPRDFAFLEFLMRNPDTVFSSEALLARVWEDDTEASSDAVRNSVKRIRQKLDDSKDEARSLIENIPRVGYRLRIID